MRSEVPRGEAVVNQVLSWNQSTEYSSDDNDTYEDSVCGNAFHFSFLVEFLVESFHLYLVIVLPTCLKVTSQMKANVPHF